MIYCYVCDFCGQNFEFSLPSSEYRKEIFCTTCGKPIRRDLVAEHRDFKDTPGSWPMVSDAAGVHPDQAKELAEHVARRGVPTEINADGNPVFTSREHRKKFCQATGIYDRNAGIGDATPKHNMRKVDVKKRKERRGALIKALEKTKDLNNDVFRL